MQYLCLIAQVLLIVGGLNWGLVAFFDFNLVSWLFGGNFLENATYGAVALAALYKLGCLFGLVPK